jgi:hypothetical protein
MTAAVIDKFLSVWRAVVIAALPLLAVDSVAAPPASAPQDLKTLAARYPCPAAWDAALFFPVRQSDFAPFISDKAWSDINLPGLKKPARLSVTGATIETGWGDATAVVNLRLEGEWEGAPASAELVLRAQLVPDPFVAGTDGSGVARFHVALEAGAGGAWTGHAFGTADLGAEIKKRNVFGSLGKKIEFSLPVPTDFSRQFGMDEEVVLAAGREGWVKLHVKVPLTDIQLKVTQVAPIFVPHGVWLCVRFDGTPEAPVGEVAGTLEEALARYESEAPETGRLLVNSDFVENFVNDFGEREEVLRTATITLVDHGGQLFDSGGDVSVQVWPEGAGSASVTVKPTAFSRDGDFYAGCAYRANAKADLHIHMDPGPTGGFGFVAGANGETSGWIETKMEMTPLEKDGAKALVLAPQFDAGQELVGELRSNGQAKTKIAGGMISCSIPSVGARVAIPVPPDIVPPLTLLANKPIALTPSAAAVPAQEKAPYAIITPVTGTRDAVGWKIDFTLTFATLTQEEAKGRRKTVDDLTDSFARPDLKIGKIEILVGSWAIGPNNDLVKAVLAMIHGGENVFREAQRAGKNIDREAKRGAENVASTARIAVKDTGRELRTARTNVGRELTQGRKILVRNAQSALAAAGKAGNWVAHVIPHPPIPHPHINLPGHIRVRF